MGKILKVRPESFPEKVFVTRPMLAPLGEVMDHLVDVWESGWLTNGGAKHAQLEHELSKYLGAPRFSLFNNGTIALVVACQALRLSGEVITTPFTFPATPHVLTWNNVTPVFCDIDPATLTIDPASIESLITARTTGILGVHVYGMPCYVDAIQRIADEYGLKVIYDAAHAFGTEIDGSPIAEFGDATMFSFHATKLFHTAEGGGLAVSNEHLKNRIDLLKNFGIKNEVDVVMPGINGKMNEVQAAIGLANMRHLEEERCGRAEVARVYQERIADIDGISCFTLPNNIRGSMQYFVVRVDSSKAAVTRDQLYEGMKEFNVFARRYFYPLCNEHNCYRSLPSADVARMPVAFKASREVLALPFFGGLGIDGAHKVADVISYFCQKK